MSEAQPGERCPCELELPLMVLPKPLQDLCHVPMEVGWGEGLRPEPLPLWRQLHPEPLVVELLQCGRQAVHALLRNQ